VRFLEDCLYVLGVSLELEQGIKASCVTLLFVENVIFLGSQITLSRIKVHLSLSSHFRRYKCLGAPGLRNDFDLHHSPVAGRVSQVEIDCPRH
jgi:hypothetical protein